MNRCVLITGEGGFHVSEEQTSTAWPQGLATSSDWSISPPPSREEEEEEEEEEEQQMIWAAGIEPAAQKSFRDSCSSSDSVPSIHS
ncbi:unnamed protein product [Lota lota]